MSAKKLDKEDEQLLRAYARELPIVMETSHEVHRLTGAEILKMGYLDYKGRKLVLDKVYDYMMPVQVAANHYNRLKHAWLKSGQEGLTIYLKSIAKMMESSKNEVAKEPVPTKLHWAIKLRKLLLVKRS